MHFGTPAGSRNRDADHGPARLGDEFRRFGFLVYRVALGILKNREEAEDLVLDVFAHKAKTFLEAHPDIAPAEFGHWLHRVAKNLALDRLRARKRASASLEEESVPVPAPEDTPGEPAAPMRLRLLSALEETDQEILRGKYGHGLSWEEVCRKAGMTLAQARYRAQKALAKLRKLAGKEAGYALD